MPPSTPCQHPTEADSCTKSASYCESLPVVFEHGGIPSIKSHLPRSIQHARIQARYGQCCPHGVPSVRVSSALLQSIAGTLDSGAIVGLALCRHWFEFGTIFSPFSASNTISFCKNGQLLEEAPRSYLHLMAFLIFLSGIDKVGR